MRLLTLLLLVSSCTSAQRRHVLGGGGTALSVGGMFAAGHLANMDGRGTCAAPQGTQCPELWETTGAAIGLETTAVVLGVASLLYWIDGSLWGRSGR